jgi:lipopolysaccharide export system protein LptA
MLRFLTLLALVSPVMAEGADGDAKKGEGMLGLLPDGSQLKGVMIPRYDENRKLVGVMKSKVMTLVNSGQMAGKDVTVEFFNPDQTPRGRIDLVRVNFFEEKEATEKKKPLVTKQLLVADESVKINVDGMTTVGTGLRFDFLHGKGFLHGPGTTILPANFETTMKSKPTSLRATAAVGLALVTQPLAAAPPEPAPAETTEVAAAPSGAPAAAETNKSARAELREVLKKSEDATRAATEFLDQQDLLASKDAANPTPATVPKPLEITQAKTDSTIDFDGGFYFDMQAGEGIFLKNVRASTPDFDLSGADEVKLFFGKKAEKPPVAATADKPKKAFADFSGNVGDIERVVANGAILVKQKNPKPGDAPMQASGAIFSYNIKTEEIVITGGFPWFKQGDLYMRATEANAIFRYNPKTGKGTTEGKWGAGGPLEKIKK